jgi:hypothetical protein
VKIHWTRRAGRGRLRAVKAGFRSLPVLLGACLSVVATARANITFNLIPDPGTPQSVVDAFGLAADRWSALIANDVTINVAVGYPTLSPGILGQTINTSITPDYASVRAALNASATTAVDASAYAHLQVGPNYTRLVNHTSDNPSGTNSATVYSESLSPVYVTRANAKALGLLGSSTELDGTIRFSSNIPFDFNPGDGVSGGQYDFVSIASHEMGHLLGFASTVDQIEQSGGAIPGSQLPSSILDLFRFSASSLAAGPGVIDTAADTRAKFFSVDGGATSVAGFATGAIYGSGYQASHWKEFTFKGLMDPTIFGGRGPNISNTDMFAFDALGYRLAPEPGTSVLFALGAVFLGWALRKRQR